MFGRSDIRSSHGGVVVLKGVFWMDGDREKECRFDKKEERCTILNVL